MLEGAVPEGWEVVRFGDACELNPRKPPPDALPADAPVTFVPMPAVDADLGIISAPDERSYAAARKGYTAFQNEDVIFAKITPCMENGKAAIARGLTNGLGFGSTEFHVLRPNGTALPEYLFYYVRQESFRQAAEAEMTGSVGQKRVPKQYMRDAEIPLPPLAEQRRIVAKLEEVLARVYAARERLEKVPAILKRFRQSVLAAACSGRLTEGWREEHPEVESAAELLERIQIRREDRNRNHGSSPGPEEIEYGEMPPSWLRTSIGECFQVRIGSTPSRKEPTYWGGEIPWVSSGEVRFSRILDTAETITEAGLANSSTQINPAGSVLLGMIGEGRTRGQAAILDINACNNQNCAAIWVPETPIPPEFVYYWLWSQYGENRRRGAGNSQPALNKARVQQLPFPLPPLPEQHEIVRGVEAMFAWADAIEQRVSAATERTERLRQAVLAKAFRGELVPTEVEVARREGRDYESASTLLGRGRGGKSPKRGRAQLQLPSLG